MLAGIMRFSAKPPKILFRLLSMTAKFNNVDLIYLTAESIDVKRGIVKGEMLLNDQIIEVEREVPDYIDISSHYFNQKNKKKYREKLNFLKKHSELSIDSKTIINKDLLQDVLSKNKKFQHLAIPTYEIDCFEDIIYYIEKFKKVVVKPVGGLQGRGVIAIEKQDDKFILNEQKKQKKLKRVELEHYYHENLKQTKHIVQKYISSVSKDNIPIDCRLHLEKNGCGEWEVARQFVRLGLGQTVVSNINQGGCIIDAESYLKDAFPTNWEDIYANLNWIGKSIPYMLEQYNDKEYMVMGFDVGIDSEGNLYLFEVNSFPVLTPQRGKVAKLRGEYYAYRINKKRNKETEEKIKMNNKQLEAENKRIKKQLEEIKTSRSWKLSKPIRVIGKIIK